MAKKKKIIIQQNEQVEEKVNNEEILKKENIDLQKKLQSLEMQIIEGYRAQKKNAFIQNEIQRVLDENHEYMNYLNKKLKKRENVIVSLSDNNKNEIHILEKQSQEIIKLYDEKKKELNNELLTKQIQLSQYEKKQNDMKPFMDIQQVQNDKIMELEKKLSEARQKNATYMERVKQDFLDRKLLTIQNVLKFTSEEFEPQTLKQMDFDIKKSKLCEEAQKETHKYINDYMNTIKIENKRLRHDMTTKLIETSKLEKRKQNLMNENSVLIIKQMCAQDLLQLHKFKSKDLEKSVNFK
ncbi:hypothetical protein A3Q56_05962 [Intoshia linei]|uniref:DUF4515 domain-containing protein n=1 Tax=Intoshia linei TaxID=1819745 RepID=A0A177AXR7_9BILA|nr:hypothetical protein A3Q56_05962 [Intoshia linei]